MSKYIITIRFPEAVIVRTLSSTMSVDEIYRWLKTTVIIGSAGITVTIDQ